MIGASDLAARFNLHKAGREWRGTCPACGYGADAFTISTGKSGKPLFWCAACQDKAAISAVLKGVNTGLMPAMKDRRAEAERTAQRAQEALGKALAIWNGALPVALDDPTGRYLSRRGLAAAISSPALRYRSDCQHWNPKGRYPALICRVDDVKGAFMGLQRIFLKQDGRKSNVEPAKACKGPIWGGAIRIGGNAPEIVIAEGPETAIAAGLIMNLPAWSAISAGNLSKGVILPQEIVSIVIAADNDPSGVHAAESAATRWQREGRRVRIIKPNLAGQDFNDVLITQTANGGAA